MCSLTTVCFFALIRARNFFLLDKRKKKLLQQELIHSHVSEKKKKVEEVPKGLSGT